MRIIPQIVILISAPLAAQSPVSEAPFSQSQDVVPAFSPSGPTTLATVRAQLDVSYPHGRKERGDLTVVYDSQSGSYLWRYSQLRSPTDTTTFLQAFRGGGYPDPARGLVEFIHYPTLLNIKVYKGLATSLYAAKTAAIGEIQQILPVFENGGLGGKNIGGTPIRSPDISIARFAAK